MTMTENFNQEENKKKGTLKYGKTQLQASDLTGEFYILTSSGKAT